MTTYIEEQETGNVVGKFILKDNFVCWINTFYLYSIGDVLFPEGLSRPLEEIIFKATGLSILVESRALVILNRKKGEYYIHVGGMNAMDEIMNPDFIFVKLKNRDEVEKILMLEKFLFKKK